MDNTIDNIVNKTLQETIIEAEKNCMMMTYNTILTCRNLPCVSSDISKKEMIDNLKPLTETECDKLHELLSLAQKRVSDYMSYIQHSGGDYREFYSTVGGGTADLILQSMTEFISELIS